MAEAVVPGAPAAIAGAAATVAADWRFQQLDFLGLGRIVLAQAADVFDQQGFLVAQRAGHAAPGTLHVGGDVRTQLVDGATTCARARACASGPLA